MKYVRVHIKNKNKKLFSNLSKFILFIKSVKYLEIFKIYLENVILESLNVLITLLIIIYCRNIKQISLELINDKDIIINNKKINSISSSINNINNNKNLNALNIVDYLLEILNNYLTKINNYDIFDRNTIIKKIKQRSIDSIYIKSDRYYNLILYLWIAIYFNDHNYFYENINNSYNKNTMDYAKYLSIKKKANYDVFDYFKELNTCCNLHKSYINIDNNNNNYSLTSYKIMSSLPYFIGYLKVVSSLYININDIFKNPENYIQYYKIISLLQNKSIIKSLKIIDNINENIFKTDLYNRLFNFKNLTYLSIYFDCEFTIEYIIHILKSIANNFINLQNFYIKYEDNNNLKHIIMSILNKFSYCIDSVSIIIIHNFFLLFNQKFKEYDLDTLYMKLIILMTNKKNINNINIPVCYNSIILKYLFKSFNKKSALTLLKKNLFLYSNYNLKIISTENKKLLLKIFKYNKLNNYIVSFDRLFECLIKT